MIALAALLASSFNPLTVIETEADWEIARIQPGICAAELQLTNGRAMFVVVQDGAVENVLLGVGSPFFTSLVDHQPYSVQVNFGKKETDTAPAYGMNGYHNFKFIVARVSKRELFDSTLGQKLTTVTFNGNSVLSYEWQAEDREAMAKLGTCAHGTTDPFAK